jgi:hypothetical protein
LAAACDCGAWTVRRLDSRHECNSSVQIDNANTP